MPAGSDWTRPEVEATVSDYFDMLSKELRGEPFNKAEHNRRLLKFLPGRTRGSIERKHQNISAVLIDLGFPYIDGYKPLKNVQSLLREVIEERLGVTPQLEDLVEKVVIASVEAGPIPQDLLSICVPAPKEEEERYSTRVQESPRRSIRTTKNYLEIEARNRSLGLAGEKLVLEFEHQRLWTAGQRKLADRIEHVSESRGDGFGYDIQSFEEDGRERLIEVKTTRFGSMTPFFASRNEVNVSEDAHETFQLYRLFKFTDQPRLFILPGSLGKTCRLSPVQYSAVPR